MSSMSRIIRPGTRLTINHGPEAGQAVVVWSAAPASGTYWCHLGDVMVLVKIRLQRGELSPRITVEEYA